MAGIKMSKLLKLILIIIPVTDWLVMGIDRILRGKVLIGIIWLLTGAICGIGWILDIVFYLVKGKLFLD